MSPRLPIRTITAIYEVDDRGNWFGFSPDLPGAVVTSGSLVSARTKMVQAAAVIAERDEDELHVLHELRLADSGLQAQLKAAADLRDRLRLLEEETCRQTREAIRAARAAGSKISLRDLGDLLGISYQRVGQILHEI